MLTAVVLPPVMVTSLTFKVPTLEPVMLEESITP